MLPRAHYAINPIAMAHMLQDRCLARLSTRVRWLLDLA